MGRVFSSCWVFASVYFCVICAFLRIGIPPNENLKFWGGVQGRVRPPRPDAKRQAGEVRITSWA